MVCPRATVVPCIFAFVTECVLSAVDMLQCATATTAAARRLVHSEPPRQQLGGSETTCGGCADESIFIRGLIPIEDSPDSSETELESGNIDLIDV